MPMRAALAARPVGAPTKAVRPSRSAATAVTNGAHVKKIAYEASETSATPSAPFPARSSSRRAQRAKSPKAAPTSTTPVTTTKTRLATSVLQPSQSLKKRPAAKCTDSTTTNVPTAHLNHVRPAVGYVADSSAAVTRHLQTRRREATLRGRDRRTRVERAPDRGGRETRGRGRQR